jgi:hypothetical protein
MKRHIPKPFSNYDELDAHEGKGIIIVTCVQGRFNLFVVTYCQTFLLDENKAWLETSVPSIFEGSLIQRKFSLHDYNVYRNSYNHHAIFPYSNKNRKIFDKIKEKKNFRYYYDILRHSWPEKMNVGRR